jgi:hypothetical protein
MAVRARVRGRLGFLGVFLLAAPRQHLQLGDHDLCFPMSDGLVSSFSHALSDRRQHVVMRGGCNEDRKLGRIRRIRPHVPPLIPAGGEELTELIH